MQALFESALPLLPFIFLVFLRVSIMIASLPAPFGTGSPAQVRVGLAFFIALALVAPHLEHAPEIALEIVPLVRAAFGELLVGAVIGLTVRVTLAAADVAGNLAGLSMGQGFAQTVDPTFGEQTMPTGRMFSALAVLLFFSLSGHHVTIGALSWSLEHAPVGDALRHAVHEGTVELGLGLVAQGLRIASPIVGVMFIVQLGMGLVARSAPRVQIFALTFAITSAVGGLVLVAAMPSVVAALTDQVGELEGALMEALGGRP